MSNCYIDKDQIQRIDIINIKGGLTAQQVYNKYKPDYFINLALYDMASGENITLDTAGNTITKIDSQKKFSLTNDYISFQRTSIRYAPVKKNIVLDQKNGIFSFYLNGTLQNEISLNRKQYQPGTFSLMWKSEKSRKGKRIFEISTAKVSKLQTEPIILPAVSVINYFDK